MPGISSEAYMELVVEMHGVFLAGTALSRQLIILTLSGSYCMQGI